MLAEKIQIALNLFLELRNNHKSFRNKWNNTGEDFDKWLENDYLTIKELEELNDKENDGRGINSVEVIIIYLYQERTTEAKLTYQHDGDKIASYPKIQKWLEKHFGCRTHLNIDCQKELCKTLRKYNEDKLNNSR